MGGTDPRVSGVRGTVVVPALCTDFAVGCWVEIQVRMWGQARAVAQTRWSWDQVRQRVDSFSAFLEHPQPHPRKHVSGNMRYLMETSWWKN